MSGVYLHGIIIRDPATDEVLNVVVEDNIFSHSELRKNWLMTDMPHKAIYEWSWDYVTKKFMETPSDLQPLAQKWIDENLATFSQLRAWIDRNWVGLVCSPGEIARMLHLWQLLSNPKSDDVLVNNFLLADQEWNKAEQKWDKACQERAKAWQEWNKAEQKWAKAWQEWKCRVMKPVYLELLDEYVTEIWKDAKDCGKME